MSSKVFFYCLKVWLASVLIGPALFCGCLLIIDSEDCYTLTDFLRFWGFGILYGFLFSVISFLLFWACMAYVLGKGWSFGRRRLITVVLGIILTVAPFLVLFQAYGFVMPTAKVAFCLCYLLPILAGIFIYRYPRPAQPGAEVGAS